MADWWVDDAATDNTGSGTTYDDPKKYLWKDIGTDDALFNIASPPSAGDTVYVLKDHVEYHTAAFALINNGTRAAPIKIIGVDSFNSGSPDTLAAAQSCILGHETGDINYNIALEDSLYFDRFLFKVGDEFNGSDSLQSFVIENSKIQFVRDSALEGITLTAQNVELNFMLINSDLEFANSGAYIAILQAAHFKWYGGTLVDGLSTLFWNFVGGGFVDVRCVDLSHSDVDYLVGQLNAANIVDASFVKCKLAPGVSVIDSSVLKSNGKIKVYGSNSDNIYEFYEEYYEGSILSATNCYRTNGAKYDGTNGYSVRLTSSTNVEYVDPLRCKLAEIWCSANPTLTVHTITDNVTLQNDEFWIDIEYPDSTIGALGKIDRTSRSDIVATPANLTSDSSEGWTEDLTTEVKQKITETISGGQAGIHTIWACLAKPSTTVYVCPKIDVS